MRAPSKRTLNAWLNYWQEELRLRDWTIEVSVVRESSLIKEDKGYVGFCSHNTQHRQAFIRLLHPNDYAAGKVCDIEVTLVHELIHVQFAPFEYKEVGSLEWLSQEQTINTLSFLLVQLKRAAK